MTIRRSRTCDARGQQRPGIAGVAMRAISHVDFPHSRALHDLGRRAMAVVRQELLKGTTDSLETTTATDGLCATIAAQRGLVRGQIRGPTRGRCQAFAAMLEL